MDVCPNAELIALTADKQRLLDTIDDFKADGVTAGTGASPDESRTTSSSWRGVVSVRTAPDSPARAVRPERCRLKD